MVYFEVLKSEEIRFGRNKFLEVSRKRATSKEGSNEFISLSRGFYTRDGKKRYKSNFAVPLDEKVIDFVVKKIKEMFL